MCIAENMKISIFYRFLFFNIETVLIRQNIIIIIHQEYHAYWDEHMKRLLSETN